MTAHTAIIGCGNPNRRDDGAGQEVLRLLGPQIPAGADRIRLLDAGTDGMAVMFAARGCESLIIVDACRSGSAAGAIFEVPGAELEQPRPGGSFTLHDFRWDHALHAGRQIFREAFPADVTVYLIEAGSVDLGIGLSEQVAAAAAQVADKIRDRVLPDSRREQETGRDAPELRIEQGRLYLSRSAFDRHFAGGGGVVLLRSGENLMILPVRQAQSGGYLAKIRNSAGDRVVSAPDFFRDHGVAEERRWAGHSAWSEEHAALICPGFFAA
jgi:hydrogenase maturation protease